jgi:hypothetical protein
VPWAKTKLSELTRKKTTEKKANANPFIMTRSPIGAHPAFLLLDRPATFHPSQCSIGSQWPNLLHSGK